MLTLDEFTIWLQQMGYYNTLPTDLKQIWNRQTAHIFKQIVTNTRPIKQIDEARKNLIIERLKRKQSTLDCELYPYERIEIYEDNQNIERQINGLKYGIDEIDNKVVQIIKNNNNEYLKIEGLKQEIRENKEKQFILQKKCKTIHRKIEQVDSMVVSITEQIHETNRFDRDETNAILKDCIEKLTKINQKYRNTINLDKTIIQNTTITKKSFVSSTPATRTKLSCITPIETNRRDSLGLLPDSCLNDLDDCFLQPPSPPTVRWLFPNNSIKSISLFPTNSTYSNHFDHFVLEKLTKNREINDILNKLLNRNNHSFIFKLWEDQFNDLLNELNCSHLEFKDIFKKNDCDSSKDYLIELNFNHIIVELAIIKELKQIENLQDTIYKDNISKLQLYDYELDKQIKYLQEKKDSLQKQQLSSSLLLSSNSYNLQKIREEIGIINKQMLIKKAAINENISTINRLIDLIKKNCNEMHFNVEKFNNFIFDENWFSTLINNYTLAEIENIIQFPLESCKISPSELSHINSNKTKLNQLLSVLGYYLNDETIISDRIRSNLRLNLLKSQINDDGAESSINPNSVAIDRDFLQQFNELESIERQWGKRLDLLFRTIRRNVQLWSKLPLGDYLSDERQINRKPFKYYKSLLENRSVRL